MEKPKKKFCLIESVPNNFKRSGGFIAYNAGFLRVGANIFEKVEYHILKANSRQSV